MPMKSQHPFRMQQYGNLSSYNPSKWRLKKCITKIKQQSAIDPTHLNAFS